MKASSEFASPAGVLARPQPVATAPVTLDTRKDVGIEDRRVPAPQVILGACPEVFSLNYAAVLHCSSCGGENPASLGYCLDKNLGGRLCKCKLQRIDTGLGFIMAHANVYKVPTMVRGRMELRLP